MKEKRKLLMELFTSTLYLSAFTFGGGYVIVSLLKERFVDQLHYIDEKEMLDLVAIAQSAPGAIAVNGAIVLGYKMAGILGIIVCVIGTIIPPIVIISVIAYFYKIFITNKIISAMLFGMRAGIGAIIISVVYDMTLSVMDEHQSRNILIMIVSFVLNYFFNIMYIILGCILLAIIDLVMRRKKHDLFTIILGLFSNRFIKLWWRICSFTTY